MLRPGLNPACASVSTYSVHALILCHQFLGMTQQADPSVVVTHQLVFLFADWHYN